jgi:hypothetical protein
LVFINEEISAALICDWGIIVKRLEGALHYIERSDIQNSGLLGVQLASAAGGVIYFTTANGTLIL